MNKFLAAAIAAVLPLSASAADLPRAPLKADQIAATPSYAGFYLGIVGGAGFANRQTSFVTAPGISTGDIWPTGGLAGITTGYSTALGSAVIQLEADWSYSFNRQGGQCGAFVLQCDVQDSFLLDQGVWIGMPWGALTGVARSNLPHAATPPSQWPIPINLPSTGWASTIMPKIGGGVTERNVKVRQTDLASGAEATDQAWLFGWWVGAGLEMPVAAGWTVATEYKYRSFNKTFIPTSSAALFGDFAQEFTHLSEQSVVIKIKTLF